MLSKSLSNPKAQIFMLQNKQTYFSLAKKNALIEMVSILINKDMFVANGNLLYDPGNSNQGSVTTQRCGHGREQGGKFKRKGTYVHLWLIHVDIWQKPIQYYKAIIFQLKINFFLKDVFEPSYSDLKFRV